MIKKNRILLAREGECHITGYTVVTDSILRVKRFSIPFPLPTPPPSFCTLRMSKMNYIADCSLVSASVCVSDCASLWVCVCLHI